MGTNHSFQSHSKIQNTQCSMEFGISFGVNYTQKTIAKTEMSSGISMGFGGQRRQVKSGLIQLENH